MKNVMSNFVHDEQGQDLIEYTLLLAFVALASAALFVGTGGSVEHYLGLGQQQSFQRRRQLNN